MVELHGSHVIQMTIEREETFSALWTNVYIYRAGVSALFQTIEGLVIASHTDDKLTPDLDFIVVSTCDE